MRILRKKPKGKAGKEKSSAPKTTALQKLLQKLVAAGGKKFKSGKIKEHTHDVQGETSRVKGHQKSISLTTGKPVMTKEGHVHQYSGAVSGEDGPAHSVEGVTKSAEDQGRGHTHVISGHTSRVKRHAHAYKLRTAGAVQEKRKRSGLVLRRKKNGLEATVGSLPVE